MNLLAKAEENQWIRSHLGEMQRGAMTSGSVFVAPFFGSLQQRTSDSTIAARARTARPEKIIENLSESLNYSDG